jgi:hypothetical protein
VVSSLTASGIGAEMTISDQLPGGGTVALMRARSNNDDIVDVIVPLAPRYAATLRTMAASFGVDTGFSIDEIDDFKLAITEIFSMLGVHHADKRTIVSFASANSALSVRLSLESGEPISVKPDELALAILRAVVDSYEFSDTAITLNKRAIETTMQR